MTTQRPDDTGEPLDREQLLSSRVSILSKLLDRRLARLVGDTCGLAVAEYRVLAQVLVHPQSTVRAIAARTYVDKAQVSRAVAVLADQGLIERSVAAADRRSPVFAATPAGQQLVREITPMLRQQEDELVAGLDGTELATVLAAMDKFIAQVAPPPEHRAEQTVAQRRQAIRAARAVSAAAPSPRRRRVRCRLSRCSINVDESPLSLTSRRRRGSIESSGGSPMPYYRQVGEVPGKRHTQLRIDGALAYEELIGEEGFSSDSALLYHRLHPLGGHRQHRVEPRRPVAHGQPPAQGAAPAAA